MYRTLLSACATGIVLAAVSAVQAQEQKAINFGIISTESTQNLRQDWQPLLDEMSSRTGLKVNAFFAPDYAGVIEGMRFNKVQVAWMGNKSAIEAVDRAGGEVFAQTVNVDGTLGYYSYISVHKDSPYNSLDDILKNAKGMNFGIGDPNSTSGFLIPSYYVFAQNNVDPKSAFRTVRSANHETNILAVANRQVDAAVHSSDTLDKITARQPDVAKRLRQVWKSPLITSDPLVWRADLAADTKKKVKDFFLAYGKTGPNAAQEKEILKKLTFGGIQESNNAQLKPIRQLELFRELKKLEADSGMKPEEKKAKLDDINRKLADMAKR